jgi:hypothetical protein
VKITLTISKAIVDSSADFCRIGHKLVEEEEVHEGTVSVGAAEHVIGLLDICE